MLCATAMISFAGAAYAQIQTTPLNNYAINPFGTNFSPIGKFASMGESGATIGPTPTGCDLYGFRAQTNPNTAINIGLQSYTFGPANTPATAPAIVTNTNNALFFIEENNLSTTFNFGCGNLLAVYKQSATNNNVATFFGAITANGGVTGPSDRTLKRNIQPIENALEIVSKLNGYTYEYRRDERPELNLPKGQRYGFITQEVQEVMPTIVRQSSDIQGNPADFQVMEYDAIIPVLAEAIKIQQTTIEDLEKENKTLEARLERLEALILKNQPTPNDASSSQLNSINNSIQLEQNRPNPTPGLTVIDYTLPKDITKASLVVVDLNGKEISNQLINAGTGSVELSTRSWISGTYIYSIVVDGRTLASKKMIVQ